MSTVGSACACIGPVGDCPCIRLSKGLKVPITETYIAPVVLEHLSAEDKSTIDLILQTPFDLLSDEDKNEVNEIRRKAFWLYFSKR